MCWRTRAENSATESAHSGETNAAAAMAHPAITKARRRRAPLTTRPVAHNCQAQRMMSAAMSAGSRLKRCNSSPGRGADPQ